MKSVRKILALIYKDSLLLIKDKAGLLLLFLMPVALVFIMTILQDNTFKTLKENRIPIVILDNDNDSLGTIITKEIRQSELFNMTLMKRASYAPSTYENSLKQATEKRLSEHSLLKSAIPEQQIRQEVASGKYQLGIIIPDSCTYKLKLSVKRSVTLAFNGLSRHKVKPEDSSHIIILIDPATKASFKTTIMSNLREFTARVEYKITMASINQELGKLIYSKIDVRPEKIISYKTEYAIPEKSNIIPNSVQHNVPAWALFAIFFIVISLSANMIKERDEGSFNRLLTMPCNYSQYIISKVITYLMVCLIQFSLMIVMGMYILPLAGLPTLNIGTQYASLMFIVISSSLAAISFGIAIGTMALTHQQAANFGSVSVVILAAVGGIWVPVFAMPPFMRIISVISPMNWGLECFYSVFIRNQNFLFIYPDIFKLLGFSFFCMIFSIVYFYSKHVRK